MRQPRITVPAAVIMGVGDGDVVEAAGRLLGGLPAGVLAADDAFDAGDFLDALPVHLTRDGPPRPTDTSPRSHS